MTSPIFKYFLFIACALTTVFMVNGCTEEVPELSSANRILADSIYRVEAKLVIKEVDSLCALVYKENFDQAIDSISKVRLKEIEKYIPSK
ncbi:hypothetical protein [Portibacter lacus]|nr:hypothetical protein [Portibacter lacus]